MYVSLFLESLEGVRVIRAFNKQKAESQRFEEVNTDYSSTAMVSGRITSLAVPKQSSSAAEKVCTFSKT